MTPLELSWEAPQYGALLTIVIYDNSLDLAKGKAKSITHLEYRHHSWRSIYDNHKMFIMRVTGVNVLNFYIPDKPGE
jgi:hypothetical protein